MSKAASRTKDLATGICLGVAMLIPSFSAGTVALITGRYQFLLTLIRRWRLLLRHPVRNKDRLVRGGSMALGAIASVVLLTRFISGLIRSYETSVLAFFTGVIAATALSFTPSLQEWHDRGTWLVFVGILFVLMATIPLNLQIPVGVWTAPLLAILSVTAMLLPGVSGSYILLVFGAYTGMIQALSTPGSSWAVLTLFIITGVVYAEFISGQIVTVMQSLRSTAHTAIFALLIGGAVLIAYNNRFSATSIPFLVAGLALYPVVETLQTNKS